MYQKTINGKIMQKENPGSDWEPLDHRQLSELLAAKQKEIAGLYCLLNEAADCIEEWGAYADEYFQWKHDLAGDIAKFRGEEE